MKIYIRKNNKKVKIASTEELTDLLEQLEKYSKRLKVTPIDDIILSDITLEDSQIIYDKIQSVFLTIRWNREDIEKVLEDNKIESTEENIDLITGEKELEKLEERSIEKGWDVLNNIVREKFQV